MTEIELLNKEMMEEIELVKKSEKEIEYSIKHYKKYPKNITEKLSNEICVQTIIMHKEIIKNCYIKIDELGEKITKLFEERK